MSRLFIGKMKNHEQIEGDYYVHNSAVIDNVVESHFNGLAIDDYVLPVCKGKTEKLFQVSSIDKDDEAVRVNFKVIKTYKPSLALVRDIICCKFFKPNIVLLNKSIKSTKNVGFHEIELEDFCPPIDKIKFQQNTSRKFYVATEDYIKTTSNFTEEDIIVVVNDKENYKISDIVTLKNNQFIRQTTFWNLYLDKVESGNKFTLTELLEYSDELYDNAPKKYNFLTTLLDTLKSEKVAIVDNPVSLYDNVIVGRKQYSSSGKPNNIKKIEPDGDNPDDYDELNDYEKYAKLLKFNPNMILYGPPGTGKTYGAIKIIETLEKLRGNDVSFESIAMEGRAKFITFHQAFSYEEFVEGIRPTTDENGEIRYLVEKGVLRSIADDCRLQSSKENVKIKCLENTTTDNKVWKVSLGKRYSDEFIYNALRDNEQIAIGFNNETDITDFNDQQINNVDSSGMLRTIRSKMEVGDLVFIFNSIRTIRLIGVITGDYEYITNDKIPYHHRRSVKWILNCEKNPIDIISLGMNNGKQLTLSTIYELRISVNEALSLLKEPVKALAEVKPYYLIIDEINRGNIAKIFGELITLVEKDKREKLYCTLPYSRTNFTLPKNLYIIGTMNTSNRSIALLDTALRRRFVFVEVDPDPTIIANRTPTIGGKVEPDKLMITINKKIAEKIDRDHCIGHSYFMSDSDNELSTIQDLFNIWYYKIIPLLMEYFYNDTKQVANIIGNKFFDSQTGEIVYLSTKRNSNAVSELEDALINIYSGGEADEL